MTLLKKILPIDCLNVAYLKVYAPRKALRNIFFLKISFEYALLNTVIYSAVQMILGLLLPYTVNCDLRSNGKDNMRSLVT